MIYGVALLSACMFIGSLVGNLLGLLIGLDSDVGGVGFAMLLLLLVTNSKRISDKLPKGYENGLNFWKGMYIPIAIAMAASQNVFGAISGGVLALVAGFASVIIVFVLVSLLNRAGIKKDKEEQKAELEA